MKKFAQILNGKLHWKFEQAEKPEFSSEIHIVEITGKMPEPQEGWNWSGSEFFPSVVIDSDLAKFARARRNKLIAETDYMIAPDYPADASQLGIVKVYRQALRDITKQASFPESINWPACPR